METKIPQITKPELPEQDRLVLEIVGKKALHKTNRKLIINKNKKLTQNLLK